MNKSVSAFDSLLPAPKDGTSLYTWMKYADDIHGNGMSDSPIGKAYVGFAYNKPTPIESNDPADYEWMEVLGPAGPPGDKGDKGDKGDSGDSLIAMYIDKPSLFVPVDAESGAVLVSKGLAIEVRLQKGSKFEALGSASVTTLTYSTDNTSSTTSISSMLASDSAGSLFSVVINIPSGQTKNKQINVISFTLKHVYAGTFSGKVQIVYVQRGVVGPVGKTLPQPLPCGYWEEKEYVVANNFAPLVMYPKSAAGKYYIRTEYALLYESDGVTPLDPATDYATYGGKGGWLLMEGYSAIYAQYVMANWARFGNAEGGVFWEHYLFSSMGVPKGGGEAADYSAYADGDTPIFDEETLELTGHFTPNLFLDFKYGGIKCNRISEPFVLMSGDFMKIKEREGHNVCVAATNKLESSTIRDNVPKILFMPNPADIVSNKGDVLVDTPYFVDGTTSSILMQSNNGVQNLKPYMTWGDGGDYDIRRFITVLCADGRISDPRSYRKASNGNIGFHPDKGYTSNGVVYRYLDVPAGYFYVGGMFTKFLLLAPGDVVRLKSCYVPYVTNDGRGTINVLAWFVENGDNYGNIPLYITMKILKYYDDTSKMKLASCDKDVLFDCTSQSEAFYGAHTAYGSKFLLSKKGTVELDITFVLEDVDTIISQYF